MATALALPFIPVEEYLRTSYEPNCEYLDGVVFSKAMPDRLHSKLQKLILLLLAAREEEFAFDTLPELHIRVTPTRFRVPDVCGLIGKPADGRYPGSDTPPLFTIEIVSLEESWPPLRGKLADHLAMGVSLVIIADPYNKTVMVATQTETLRELPSPLLVHVPVPGKGDLQIDFDELYRKLG